MILKRLALDNYCLFAGHHEFHFAPQVGGGRMRPIILFGGKNGAGKTTLLNAIQLALYGKSAAGNRLSEREYHLLLRNRIHRNKQTELRGTFASVSLEFELVTRGERHIYLVKRSWMARDGSPLQEFFEVSKDGEPLEEVSPDHWQNFIADIVPERLSQLFFFDGEKIKNIAEDITSNAAISDAIQTLLGLDTVKALQADLNIYRSKLLKDADPAAYDREVAGIEAEIERLTREFTEAHERDREANTHIHGVRAEIAALENTLTQQGGGFAKLRGNNRDLQKELRDKLLALEERIRAECDSAVPFALCPRVSRRLIEELKAEGDSRKAKLLDAEITALEDSLLSAASKHLTGSACSSVREFLSQHIGRYKESLRPKACNPESHCLSERETAVTIDLLEKASVESALRLRDTLRELEVVTRELHQVEKDLKSTPEQLSLQGVFEELNQKNQELGQWEERKRRNLEQLRELDIALKAKQRQKALIEERLDQARDVRDKTVTIEKLQPALAEYRKRLTEAKIATLQSEVTECYNRLARKSDFIHRVEIDPQTFSVIVIDRAGRSIPKEDLSSGEKQVFAIAMLWGMARTSGRPLPVVIDTPLGRLDSDHRRKLIHKYFPHAGHQVILLSTDTEVDMPLFRELRPFISHCYHLAYDEKEECTIAEDRYFWRDSTLA